MSTEIRELARNRVSCRAIALGTVQAIALIFVFMSLAAGFGLWGFDVHDYQGLNPAIWLFTFVGTSLSLYAGGYSASLSSRTAVERDGRLNGFLIWSVVNVVICLFLYSQIMDFTDFRIGESMYMAALLCQVFAMMAAVAGGAAGAKSERIFQERQLESKRAREKALLNEAYP